MKKRGIIMALLCCLALTGCSFQDLVDKAMDKLLGTETETETISVTESVTEVQTEVAESETDPPQPHEIEYTKTDLDQAPVGIVNQKNVNFRVRPSSHTATKAKLDKGEEILLLAEVKDEEGCTWWYAERVTMKGVRGYIGGDLVDVQADSYQAQQKDETRKGIILEDKVNVRKKADQNSEKIGTLKKGDLVTLLEIEYRDEYDWWHIKTKNGKDGFVVVDYIRDQSQAETEALSTDLVPAARKAFVSEDFVNLREQASTQSPILKKLVKGTRLEVLSERQGQDHLWLRVKTPDETIGHVAAEYVTIEGESQ